VSTSNTSKEQRTQINGVRAFQCLPSVRMLAWLDEDLHVLAYSLERRNDG
jgi:hypothetical protein